MTRPAAAQLAIFADSIQERFEEFHRDNPDVYAALLRLARSYARKGERRGIGHLWEVLRYERWLQTNSDDFKLNDHYRSRYARMLMARERDLRGFFDLRELRS